MAEEWVTITVRLPKTLLQQAKQQDGPFNDLIIKALEAEVVRRHWNDLLKRVDQHFGCRCGRG